MASRTYKDSGQQFLTTYLEFCRSPLRGDEDVMADLDRLRRLPMVKVLAFADDTKVRGTLMIGLKTLIIKDPDTGQYHYIGDFIVYITRYRIYPEWVVDFRLVNLNPVYRNGKPTYFHPHMTIGQDPEIGNVAKICISRGRSPIFNYIRKGQLDLAMELIANLLQSLGPDHPFYPINEWPKARFWRKPWSSLKTQGQ